MPEYPPEVLAAIDAALDELPQPESRFERDRWRAISRIAVDAAAPLIRAAERERIVALAESAGAIYSATRPGSDYLQHAFADLIREVTP
jgi:hypothetical protein